MHISNFNKKPVNFGQTSYSVEVKFKSGEARQLWFVLPNGVSEYLNDDFADSFLLCLFMGAMKRGENITSDLSFSSDIALSICELIEYWHCMYPETLKPIKVSVPTITLRRNPNALSIKKTVACFSGGIDSLFTHHRNTGKRYGWNYGLFLEGVDDNTVNPSISNDNAYQAISKYLKPDQKLYRISTNAFRSFGMHWGIFSCGYTLAASLLWFRGLTGTGLIPSTYDYRNLVPFGSHPIPDNLCSTRDFIIRHDGAGYSRLDKLKYLVKQGVDLSNLRVCFNPVDGHTNCGQCEKCIRTRLCFLALGILHPPCFKGKLTKKMINNMTYLGDHYKKAYIPFYKELKSYNMPDDIMRELFNKIS